MRALLVLVLLVLSPPVGADSHRFAASGPPPHRELEIDGATDIAAMELVIHSFQRAHPDIAVTYRDIHTRVAYERFLERERAGQVQADIVLSSAMDLQMKLVNDGYAQRHESGAARELPEWATWRNEIFGFTWEPVVIVYDRSRFTEAELPRSRWELAQLLRSQPERFRGKVGTYDVGRSGVGYLFAAQDAKQSPAAWDLTLALGAVGTRLFETSGEMLDAVASGTLLLGYNVLGSYATARARQDPRVGILLPEDYTLLTSRTAFIPRRAAHPDTARAFLDHVLSPSGQQVIAGESDLFAIHPGVSGRSTLAAVIGGAHGPLRPIRLGPGLLVYLDQVKHRLFLRQFDQMLRTPGVGGQEGATDRP